MARVRTRVINKPEHDKGFKGYADNARSLLGEAGLLVFNTAKESIQRGVKSGIVYEKYNPRRTHKASAAGQVPASDTGFLANNIFVNIDVDGLGVSVESRAEYSNFLEFGTSQMAARPFMQPALEQNKPKINRLAKRMVKAK